MIELKTKIRKWGNSFGIVVPIKKISDEEIKEGDEIVVLMRKSKNDNTFKETFGILKDWKKSTDRIMREIDEDLWFEE